MRLDVDIGLTLGAFVLEARFRSDAPVTALFGRSGSGKTTVLNAIAGLATPQRPDSREGDSMCVEALGKDRLICPVFQVC